MSLHYAVSAAMLAIWTPPVRRIFWLRYSASSDHARGAKLYMRYCVIVIFDMFLYTVTNWTVTKKTSVN